MSAAYGLVPRCGALLSLLVACGGDDDGSSGVESDKTLDEVTIGEAMDLCEWERDIFPTEDFAKLVCYAAALQSADCETFVQDCLDEPSDPVDESSCEIDPEDFDNPPACYSEITVGELEGCIEAIIDVVAAAADDVSCDSSPDDIDIPLPDVCLELQDQCPDLFG